MRQRSTKFVAAAIVMLAVALAATWWTLWSESGRGRITDGELGVLWGLVLGLVMVGVYGKPQRKGKGKGSASEPE